MTKTSFESFAFIEEGCLCLSLKMIKFFGFQTPLCNSRFSTFMVKGVTYNSMEQYITAMKAKLFHDDDAYEAAMKTATPIHARLIPVHGYDEVIWVQQAEKILYKGLKEKFKQNPGYRKYLIKTGDHQMVYCDPRDKLFGIGLSIWDPESANPDKWPGKNLLGKNLEKIRSEILADPEYKEEIKEILEEIMGVEPKKPVKKEEEPKKPEKKTISPVVFCEDCEKDFATKYTFKRHIEQMHPDKETNDKKATTPDLKKKKKQNIF